METHARFFLIGLFSLVVTALLILFVLWLGRLQLDREFQEYDVRFNESVAGLAVGGIVQYHGIQIGEVRKLSLDPEDPREVSVRVRVGADTPIKTDTKAQLSYTGLTGVAVVELFGGTPEARLLREADTSPIPRIESVPSTLSQLMSGGSGAMHSMQEVMARVAEVLSDQNIQRVSTLLDNLQAVSTSVKDDYPALRDALGDARVLEQRLSSAARRADDLLAQMQQGLAAKPGDMDGTLFEQVRTAVGEIRSAAAAIETFADSGNKTVRGIDAQTGDELGAILLALRQTSENLARITQKFDEAPANYLLGREALPAYEPEESKR
jgi:phospholipid/cholesterol/gamma-HCH transport system substrate-binding protein